MLQGRPVLILTEPQVKLLLCSVHLRADNGDFSKVTKEMLCFRHIKNSFLSMARGLFFSSALLFQGLWEDSFYALRDIFST